MWTDTWPLEVVVVCLSAALAGAATTPVTNQALQFSPYNTYSDGSGPLLENNIRAGSSYALWIYPGSYLKTKFTGTRVCVNIEVSSPKGSAMPKLRWSVDNDAFRMAFVSREPQCLPLASGLNDEAHSLILYLASSDANDDRWNKPEQAIKIRGVSADPASVLERPLLAGKRAIFYGDSITEGAWILGNSNRRIGGRWVDWTAYSDATLAWPRYIAAALDAEYGTCGSGGMSWLKPSHSSIPALPEAWRFHFKGHSRLSHGKLDPMPDYVVVNMGANDGDRDTTAAVRQWLSDVRSAIAAATPIVVIIPFGQRNRDSLRRAVSSLEDRQVRVIDLGDRWANGLNHYGHPSAMSFDGLHLNAEANGLYATLLARALGEVNSCPK
jgi:hypothetical protein